MKIGKIEKQVKIPVIRSKHKYPWDQMGVGDSVLIQPHKGEKLLDLKRKIDAAARYHAEKEGRKYETLIKRKENGVRVLKVE